MKRLREESDSESLLNKKLKPDSKMDIITKSPGLQHISEDISKLLDKKSLMNCRLVNSSWKEIQDKPKFWLKKINLEENYLNEVQRSWNLFAQEVSDYNDDEDDYYVASSHVQSWKTLVQDLDDDNVSREFLLILMKMYKGNLFQPLEIVVKLQDASKKFPDLTKFILKHENIKSEVTVRSCDFPGQTPLHLASFYGLTGTVEKLLKKYESSDIKTKPYGGTPLYCAAYNGHLETVMFLFDQTVNPNAPDTFGQTPLRKAVVNGHANIVNFLVTKVENPNAPDVNGFTPLDMAIITNQIEMVRILVSNLKNPIAAPNHNGQTPLDLAISRKRIEIVKMLVSMLENPFAPNQSGNTPIHEAIRFGCVELVKFLASKVEDPNAPNANGDTPLKIAFQRKDREFFKIIFAIVNKK